jgi:hypothetical protein
MARRQTLNPGGAAFSIRNDYGRVIEARVFALRNAGDADEYARSLASVVAQLPTSTRPILCADHRPVVVYAPTVADRLTELFHAMNTRLERIAILVARTNATLAMQLERIVREAQFENRRVFYDVHDAVAFLQPSLSAMETARIESFLGEYAPHG